MGAWPDRLGFRKTKDMLRTADTNGSICGLHTDNDEVYIGKLPLTMCSSLDNISASINIMLRSKPSQCLRHAAGARADECCIQNRCVTACAA